jgi:MFS family permease
VKTFLRIVIGFFAGILGMLAGWAGLALLVISLAGHDQDGGIAMGAFFQIGPIGGVVGFIVGVWLFVKFGIVRRTALPSDALQPDALQPDASQPDAKQPDAAVPPVRTHISRPFAIVVVLVLAALAYEGWYELIRSPYLSHGYMKLDMQFRFPTGTVLPTVDDDVHIVVTEGGSRQALVSLGNPWRGHDDDQPGILASASLSYKASGREVSLDIPGVPEQVWPLDLGSDPDPMTDYSPFKLANGPKGTGIELSYRLSTDN